jgi:hypothetical protein
MTDRRVQLSVGGFGTLTLEVGMSFECADVLLDAGKWGFRKAITLIARPPTRRPETGVLCN